MSNAVYPSALDAFLTGAVNVTSDDIAVQLVDASYTYDAAHDFLDDVTGAVASPVVLTTPSVVDGEFFADDAVFPAVPSGDTITGLIVYQDTGTPSTSHLLAYIDTRADTVPISVATNDGDITVTWPSGRLFKI